MRRDGEGSERGRSLAEGGQSFQSANHIIENINKRGGASPGEEGREVGEGGGSEITAIVHVEPLIDAACVRACEPSAA